MTTAALPALARVEEVVDTYHGTEVRDPYRWMEKGGAEYDAYLSAQDAYTRATLAAIPGRERLYEAIHAANRGGTTRVNVADIVGPRDKPRVFLFKQAADQDTALLYVRDGWSGADRLLLDPRTRDHGEVSHVIDHAVPSPDGKHLAFGLAASGSEDCVIQILEVDSGKLLAEKIDRAQYAAINWRDNRSFFYWRRRAPAPTDTRADWFRYSATFLHVLGDDPERAQPVFSPSMKELALSPEASSEIRVWSGSRWALAIASQGTSADLEYFVAPIDKIVPGKTPWRRLSGPDDKVYGMLARGDTVYALSYRDAERFRLLSLDARTGTLGNARVFAAERAAILQEYTAAEDGMYLQLFDGGKTRLERVSYDGKKRELIALPYDGTASISGDLSRRGVHLTLQSPTSRARDFLYDPDAKDPAKRFRDLRIREPWPVDFSHLTSELVEVRSADGSLVPMSIVRRSDTPRDGSSPALLGGYQAYGETEYAGFDPLPLSLVDRGVVHAYCYGRGTGNRGRSWHRGGIKHHKERGVEDFLACAQHLVTSKLTSPARLTVTGTSAGGMVVGGAITRQPELFAAAILRVTMTNILRFEETEGGAFNIPELGSRADADDFRHLLASDPYHRVADGARLPAILVTAARHDVRVPSWQQAKLAARAQAVSRALGENGRPVLLRVEADAGHFGSTESQAEREWADLYAFALWRSGVEIKP